MTTQIVYMPHPGHFICARDCRFFLNTYVNGVIVSTVGEYMPSENVREILAQSRGIVLEGIGEAREADWLQKHGWQEIGCDRTYESMVFKAKKDTAKCCPWRIRVSTQLDFAAYNDANAAAEGHRRLVAKWANSKKEKP